MSSNPTFVVIGLGAFGGMVASELSRFGNHVLGIDTDERRVARFADDLAATAILEASDEMALREAGVDNYDIALVAIGDSLEASLLATMNLRLLGVPKIWAKATHRTHHRILTKLGVDRVILPEHEMGRHVAQILNNAAVQDYVGLGNSFSVVSIRLPENRDGQPLSALHLDTRHALHALGMMRGTEFIETAPGTIMRTGDLLLVLGKRPDLQAFGEVL